MQRVKLSGNRFVLVNLEEQVFLDVIKNPNRELPYVKELTEEQFRELINSST